MMMKNKWSLIRGNRIDNSDNDNNSSNDGVNSYDCFMIKTDLLIEYSG